MVSIPIEYPTDLNEYELLDSGNGLKLENFAGYTISRPDPRILWQPSLNEQEWKNAHASYARSSLTEGHWNIRKTPPQLWLLHFDRITMKLQPTQFKHIGVFPEQAVNWRWLTNTINGKPFRVLNLFAYTGGATIASALASAHVTHVDSVKSVINWAKENAKLSHIPEKSIRWIEDDAYKFVLREQRRGNTYDGIILDPPRFGRGTKGEVWKLETNLPNLISACKNILSKNPVFFLINAYTADISSVVLGNMIEELMGGHGGTKHFGELALQEKSRGRLLPSGIFARWQSHS